MFLPLVYCAMLIASADAPSTWLTGDEWLLLSLTREANGQFTEACVVDGAEFPYRGSAGAIQLDGQDWAELLPVEVVPEGTPDARGAVPRITLRGSAAGLDWRLTYERSGPGRVTKQLVIETKEDVVLARVAAASFASQPAAEIVSTGMQDIAAFIRNANRGIFISLDFPYSRIVIADGSMRVTYPAFETIHPGQPYTCHSLTIGATGLSGELRYGRDTGEVAAMDQYIQERYPQRFDRPMFVSACINNRYTMPREGMVWYTYKDHPTLSFNIDLMKRELDLMPQLGMEFYQVFPGVFDWVPDDPNRDTVRGLVRYGSERGVRIGDYSGTSQVFCAHYNEYGNTLDHPEWRAQDAQGNRGGFCFGVRDFVEYYCDTVVPAAAEFGFELHCLDFLNIVPCFATDHGHPAGEDSVYHQICGLIRFMETLAAVDPDMMVWSNSGNWAEFLPKIAWSNPNLYLTDPYIATPWPGLNMTRLLDDARREQMVSLHYGRFVPYRSFTNCQYFFSQNSIVPDIRNYQYGALSSIAVTPNLCLAEIRPWMDRLPAPRQDEVKAFYSYWTQFLREHFALWKSTYHVGNDPAPGGVELYGHANGDHGYVFVVNPNYSSATVEVPLDERLGFHGEGSCEVRELYPVEHLLLTDQGPTPPFGSFVTIEAPAQQVRVLEVRPASTTIDIPRVYGIRATLERTGEGYLFHTAGPQGTMHRFAVRTPDGEAPLTNAVIRQDVPKQAQRLFAETPLRLLGQDGPYALFEITFRRAAAPTELRSWRLMAGDLPTGESRNWPQGLQGGTEAVPGDGPFANLRGAYIDNAFSELQDTWIELHADGNDVPATPIVSGVTFEPTPPKPIPAQDDIRAWWMQTEFHLPFMYTIGAEPAFDEHTILVFPMVDPSRVQELQAWVNGAPLEVRRYAYPRNRALGTYWADLVGSSAHGGDNTLVVHVAFRPE
ncbi:MAG: hypothetical protein IT364_03130 [Candidatus Hydrogenedentes bacterium]|nr:hypothetical protein [Candidatus Hydrogenedentota bacterium]